MSSLYNTHLTSHTTFNTNELYFITQANKKEME